MAINKDKINQEATKYIQKGQFDKAIKELQKIVFEEPDDVRTIQKIAELYARMGDSKNAIDNYSKVADVYTKQGFFLKAVAIYKNIIKIDASRIDIYEKLAQAYSLLGIVNEAINQYNAIIAIYEKNGNYKESISIIKKILELSPNDILMRMKLSELYYREGMNQEAIEEYKNIAKFLKENSRIDEYLRVIERLSTIDHDNLDYLIEVAEIYLSRNDFTSAMQKLQIAYKINPKEPKVLTLIADAFRKNNQIANAVAAYKELLNIYTTEGRLKEADGIRRIITTLTGKEISSAPISKEFSVRLSDSVSPQSIKSKEFRPISKEIPIPSSAPKPIPEQSVSKPIPITYGKEKQFTTADIPRLLTETDVYLKYGLKQKAINHLKTILSLDNENLEAHLKYASLLENSGDNALLVSTYMNIANIYLKRENIEEAKRYLLMVIEIDPLNEAARNTYDMLSEGKIEEVSDEIVELDNYEFPATNESVEEKKPEIEVDIEEEPEEIIEIKPDAQNKDVDIDVISPKETSNNQAKQIEKEIVAEQKEDFTDELEEAEFFISQQLIDEAIEIYNQILSKDPDHPVAKAKLKQLTDKSKKINESIEKVMDKSENLDIPIEQILSESKKQLLKIVDANDAQAHYDLGLAYKEMGLYEEAIEEFKISMQNEDKEIPALNMIALINFERQRYTDAISIFKKLLNYDEITDEQRVDFLYYIGESYLKINDKSEALFYLNKVYRHNPNYRNVKQLLALIQSAEKKN
ncbi:MAG: tetratricopeptide repeat protein [Deltaproteobacteria bacterium]|nr:tetratricopeptide repeat protein [Deltaproteobacteria bacterium]